MFSFNENKLIFFYMNFFFNFLVYFIQFKEKILLLIQNHAYYNIAMMIVIKQNAGEKGKFRHK